MPTYGEFETVEELASAGPFAVYSARRKGGASGPPAFAVKVYKTADVFADAEVVEREAAAFLEAAGVQRGLPAGPARGGDGHWAPVHDAGRTADAVYYATDLYPVSVQRMVDSRRELDARSIAHVIEGVVAGLEEVAKAKGRGHGALQPSNVLLGSPEVEQAQVALGDPEPDSRLDKNADVQDQRGLAGLLFQMVVYRPPPRAGAVATGPEWQRMGAAGELLRGLCETLLNVQAGQLVPWAQVRAKLDEVLRAKAPSKGGMSLGVKAAIAAVVLLAAGGGAYVAFKPGPKEEQVWPDPRDSWKAADVAPLKQRLDEVKARIKPDDASGQERAAELAKKLKELGESIEWLARQPDPISAEQVAFLEGEIKDRDTRLAAAEEVVEVLEGENPIRGKVDPTRDPRGKKELWLASRVIDYKDQVTVIDRLLSRDPTLRAGFEELRDEVDHFEQLVSETRAKAWGESPEVNQEILTAAAEATEWSDSLRTDLRKMRDGARDALQGYIKAAADSASSLRSVQLQDRMRAALQAIRKDLDTDARGWQEVTGQLGKLEELLKSIDGAFAAGLGLEPPPAGSEVAYAGAEKHLEELRESLIGKLPEATDSADPTLRKRVEEAAATYNERVADLRGMYTAALKAEGLLAAGYGLDEFVEGGSIAELDARVRGAKGFEPLRSGVEKVAAKVDGLRRVKSLGTADALVGVINDGGSGLSAVLTAWRALPGRGYPASASDLSAAVGVHARVAAAVQKAAGPRGAVLKDEVDGQLKAMWLGWIERAKGGVAEVNAAFELTGSIPGGGELVKSGPAWLRYNHKRWELMKAVAAVGDMPAKEQIEQLHGPVMKFVNDSKSLTLNGQAGAAQLEKDLNPYVIKKVVTMDEMGPGRAQWTFEEDQQKGVVRYRWKGKRGDHVLEFRPMVMGEDQVTYLCTTEMSVGLFADIVESFGKWDDVRGVPGNSKKLLDAGQFDTRKGVRTVRWVGTPEKARLEHSVSEVGEGVSKNGLGWHSVSPAIRDGRSYYKEGIGPAREPSDDDPVDWVSPSASLYVARLVGCRLPSSAEWDAAVKMGANARPNLRDSAYLEQYNYVKEKLAEWQNANAVEYPAVGAMRLPPKAGTMESETPKPEVDVGVHQGGPDGFLYFAKVNEAMGGETQPKFYHLIGNVWEYVHEEPLKAEALTDARFESIMALTNSQAWEQLRVVGGSALSGPEVPTDKPVRFMRGDMLRGWSDVGFRLAFSTGAGAGGGGSPKQRLLALLQKTPYLSKPDQN